MELYNHVRASAPERAVRDNQHVVVAPNDHRAFAGLKPDSKSGDRELGDPSFDMDGAVFGWFDRWLKGDARAFPATTPRVRYYTMGADAWSSAAQWAPARAKTVRMYLRSAGRANSLYGDGRLTRPPRANPPIGTCTTPSWRYGRSAAATVATAVW